MERLKEIKKKIEGVWWKRWIPLLPILLFTIAYISLLKSRDIWTDEAYMMQMLRETKGLKDAILYAASDTHPPAYFVLLKAVTMILGQNLVAAKLISIASLVGTMLLGVRFLNRNINIRASVIYVLFIGALPCSMQFSVEIRMYGLALFALTGCGIAAYNLVLKDKKQYWFALVLFGVLASYTHYFSLAATALIFGMLFCVLLISNRKALIYWALSVVACIVLYLPWLPYFYKQFTRVSGGFWIPEITWKTIGEYISWYFDTDMPYMPWMLGGILILSVVLLVWKLVKQCDKKSIFALVCLLVWFFTIIVGVIVSAAVRPIFLIKYSFPMVGLLGIAFAYGIEKLPDRIIVLLSCFLLCLGIVDYENSYWTEYKSTLINETLEFFDEHLKPQDKVAYNYNAFGFIYAFYFDEDQLVELDDVDFSEDYDGGCIYLMHTTWESMPDNNVLAQYGWQQEYCGMYGIEHNYFKIYRYYKE